MSQRHIARAGVVLAAVGAAALFSPSLASAHVTAKVLGEAAAKGGYTKITYRVPNEDATAGTVKVEIKLPAEHPLTSVRTKPMPGWTSELTKVKLDEPVTSHGAEITEAYSTVVWTAVAPAKIAPGQFEEFELSVGALPEDVDSLVTPAIQSYENGKVVAWDQPTPDGGEEPERPAPEIALTAAVEGHGHGAAANAADGHDDHAAAASSTDDTARWLGGAGLVVGALGLGLGAGAVLRARRATAAAKAGE
ncbi:YcnI family copper-binding membrane protein [Actinokineospora pegani]|uniref:YcnI family copper-binding membrane protein n=1 Tax=Actinokineospora pegani TaxID=2654637 RepID=UPI0012EAF299|nr:YcnI family protein [Actinokineospora pegani]